MDAQKEVASYPGEYVSKLKEAGSRELFLPGTPLSAIIEWTESEVPSPNQD